MQPSVFIVILNWNGYRDTKACLESVMGASYDNKTILLVDNGSIDGSVTELRKAYPWVTIIENHENIGFSRGNNQAIQYAMERGADYIWLLNNDTIISRDALEVLVAAAESPGIGLASPLIYYHDSPGELQFCGSVIDWKNHVIRHIGSLEDLEDIAKEKDLSLWGTALFIKRKVIKDVGTLNEKYFAYHEDEDYSLRVNRAGYRCIIVPEARILHKNSRSTGSNDAPMQVFLRSRNLFFLWMDKLKGVERISYFRRYLAHIISYGGALKEKNLPDSVEACMDGVWHAFRGAGGPRNPEITMPISLRRMFRFLFSWHPYFWASLLRGDFSGIAANVRKRTRVMKAKN